MKRIVSGIQPTGDIHLGNYLGAIKNWSALQNEGECFFFLADLHAITLPIEQQKLKRGVTNMAAMLMACGIGGEESVLFSQMMVPEHTELQWLLSCTARMGWLNRMTQFKDKGGNDAEAAFRAGFHAAETQEGSEEGVDVSWSEYDQSRPSVGVGLFAYPILQAADVLLYDATHVPVGDDQDQHLQLVRDISDSFNHQYGETVFTKPQAVMTGPATRVMSLKNGRKKMSKSDDDDAARINLTDDAAVITKKFRRATTDTLMLPSEIDGLTGRPEVTNLVNIYAAITEQPVADVLRELGGQGHGVLKQRLADATVAVLEPINAEYQRLLADEDHLWDTLIKGAVTAQIIAGSKMETVRKTIFGYQ